MLLLPAVNYRRLCIPDGGIDGGRITAVNTITGGFWTFTGGFLMPQMLKFGVVKVEARYVFH